MTSVAASQMFAHLHIALPAGEVNLFFESMFADFFFNHRTKRTIPYENHLKIVSRFRHTRQGLHQQQMAFLFNQSANQDQSSSFGYGFGNHRQVGFIDAAADDMNAGPIAQGGPAVHLAASKIADGDNKIGILVFRLQR